MSEFQRVLLGAKMVMDHAVKRMTPELRHKMERNFTHVADLLGTLQEISRSVAANARCADKPSSSDNIHHEHSPIEKSDRSATVSSVSPMFIGVNIGSPSFSQEKSNRDQKTLHQNIPKVEPDLIGFSAVKDDETANISDVAQKVDKEKVMRERAVPSSQIGRMVGFGSLAVRMALGEVVDRASHAFSGNEGPRVLSDENAERLAESLCRMRGAALKLGQMLSLQDESSLPPSLTKALERVKQSADYMPKRQLELQLRTQLGEEWQSRFLEFDPVPIAAASIGQVHRAKLLDGTDVAVKIQYPGVADSIDSDLQNLKTLVRVTNLLPPGLFIDNIIRVASEELTEECDYLREAQSQKRYRELVLSDPILRKHVNVPKVYLELCTPRVLVSRLVAGHPIDKAAQYSQATRNAIARTTLIIAIRELFDWRFIQSDPNFANFLYQSDSKTVHMIDFGAAREYPSSFVDGYMELVWAAANRDREKIIEVSRQLGFLTGDESPQFVDAHVDAGLVVGEPFLESNRTFDFVASNMTQRIARHGNTFLEHRLTPPPNEAYSLHRKLAGAFYLCIRLKANIPCRDILEETYKRYQQAQANSKNRANR
jgi:aarF domain-containing kinase